MINNNSDISEVSPRPRVLTLMGLQYGLAGANWSFAQRWISPPPFPNPRSYNYLHFWICESLFPNPWPCRVRPLGLDPISCRCPPWPFSIWNLPNTNLVCYCRCVRWGVNTGCRCSTSGETTRTTSKSPTSSSPPSTSAPEPHPPPQPAMRRTNMYISVNSRACKKICHAWIGRCYQVWSAMVRRRRVRYIISRDVRTSCCYMSSSSVLFGLWEPAVRPTGLHG